MNDLIKTKLEHSEQKWLLVMREIKKSLSYPQAAPEAYTQLHTGFFNVSASRDLSLKKSWRMKQRVRWSNKTWLPIKHSLLFGYLHALVLLSVKDLKLLAQLHKSHMEALFRLTLLIWNIQLVNVAEMHLQSPNRRSATPCCAQSSS